MKLDKIDRKLLYQLDLDARIPLTKLARKLRISKQVASYRINRLEEKRIINSYVAMIDASKLGYTTYRCYLKLRGSLEKEKNEIIAKLKKNKPIWAIVTLTGPWDLALGISVKSVADFHKAWEGILEDHLSKIVDYEIVTYEPIYHFTKSYLIEKEDEEPPRVLGGSKTIDHDEIDIKILRMLAGNARISLVEIAKQTKLSVEGARKRIAKLEKNEIIKGYRVQIDTSKFGFEYYKAEVRLTSFKQMSGVLEFCRRNQFIYQVDKTIGGETVEIEFHVENVRQMLKILSELEEEMPGLIERYDYLTVLEQIKEEYLPLV